MATYALTERPAAAAVRGRGQARRQQAQDRAFHLATLLFAVLVLVILGGIIVSLVDGALPALRKFGLGFVGSTAWNPVKENFGAWPAIRGTIVTSLIAMLVGVPVSFGIALFITELCPAWLKRPLGIAIELLAGIPSIIYGIWGLFAFAPLMQSTVQPALIDTIGNVPWVGDLFQGPPYGIGTLTAGIILAVMVLPFVTSITRDVFETVPPMLRESAYALGATTWEVVWRIVLPFSRVGVVGGIMLGLGRALGETMAVTFVIGNAHRVSTSLLAPGTTISASIANEFTEAVGALYTSSLIALGLFGLFWLFAILATLVVNGVGAISPAIFTQPTPPPGSAGGLANAIYGSVVMTVLGTLIGAPVGILAGTYLAEYARGSAFGAAVLFVNDILLSAPSIVVGLFVYVLLVLPMGHFSAWAGSVALAILVVPVVVRTTEDMLNLVPNGLREAAAALGAPRWKVVTSISYRAARNGMITGVLLAVARISGETAPLLFTALNNQFWSLGMNAPMANLPVTIFQFALSPYDDWQRLAWGGSLVITAAILLLHNPA